MGELRIRALACVLREDGAPVIAWETIEAAIHAWIVAGSGLAGTHVYWADRGDVPSGTRIVMRSSTVDGESHDWIDRESPEDPDPGEELLYVLRGPRIVTLSLQCIGGDEHGSDQCLAILEAAITKRRLPSIARALSLAGVGFGKVGRSQAIPGNRSTVFEPRAVIEIPLHLASEVSEPGPSIAHVEVERDIEELVVETLWVPDPPDP